MCQRRLIFFFVLEAELFIFINLFWFFNPIFLSPGDRQAIAESALDAATNSLASQGSLIGQFLLEVCVFCLSSSFHIDENMNVSTGWLVHHLARSFAFNM